MRTLLALIGAGLVTLAGCVEQRAGVTVNELPATVLATLEKNARPGKIKSIIRETREKQVTYKAEVTTEGHAWEVAINGAGDLLYKKEK